MGFFLEVIVTSAADAVEAEAGGADRLELVAGLDCGGLTPTMQTIESVLRAVTIPVRVMLRHKPTMSIEDHAELEHLKSAARLVSQWKIDGFVAGFLRGGAIDEQAMLEIASAAPRIPITFHRAFDDA